MSRRIDATESYFPSFFKDVFRGNIASFLSAKEVIRFAKTSRIAKKIADYEWVWQQLSIRDYPRYIERKNPRVTWKKYYQYFYFRSTVTYRANRIYRHTFRTVYSKVPKTGIHLFFLANCYGGFYLVNKVAIVAKHYFQDSLLSRCIQLSSGIIFVGTVLGSVIIGDKIFSNRKIRRKISHIIAKVNRYITWIKG